MCNKGGAFVGDKNFSVIKMHGTTIKKIQGIYEISHLPFMLVYMYI